MLNKSELDNILQKIKGLDGKTASQIKKQVSDLLSSLPLEANPLADGLRNARITKECIHQPNAKNIENNELQKFEVKNSVKVQTKERSTRGQKHGSPI